MTRWTRQQKNDLADRRDRDAARSDEAARDADHFRTNANDDLQRDQGAALRQHHREEAANARAEAEILRDGDTPEGWR